MNNKDLATMAATLKGIATDLRCATTHTMTIGEKTSTLCDSDGLRATADILAGMHTVLLAAIDDDAVCTSGRPCNGCKHHYRCWQMLGNGFDKGRDSCVWIEGHPDYPANYKP